MKKLILLLMITLLFSSVSFGEIITIDYIVVENETTELQLNDFLEEQHDIILMAINPDSVTKGFEVTYTELSPLVEYTPKKDFIGTDTFEYYFIDNQLGDYNVIANITVIESVETEIVETVSFLNLYIEKLIRLIKLLESLK